MFNIVKLTAAASFSSVFLLSATLQAEPDSLGVAATFARESSKNISKSIPTTKATQRFINAGDKTGDVYEMDRQMSDNYHISLELLKPKKAKTFSKTDVAELKQVLTNFSSMSKGLQSKNYYDANGYELVLFTHYKGNNGQFVHQPFTIKDIKTLPQNLKEVAYANLVLRIGTHGLLKNDWEYVRENVLPNKNHRDTFDLVTGHDLKTHITISNLYKYDGKKYKYDIQTKKVVPTVGNGTVYNTPFVGKDLDLLVDVFEQVNGEFEKSTNKHKDGIRGLKIESLDITTKNPLTKDIEILHAVKF